MVGWEWTDHSGAHETARGTRWGEFAVAGHFDGRDLVVLEMTPAAESDPPEIDVEASDPDSPCPVPDGGWRVLDPVTTTAATQEATLRAAAGLDGYAGAWLDQSINPAYGSTDPAVVEAELNDPRQLVLNVRVTHDLERAETTLRAIWGGALCVSRARFTEQELMTVQHRVIDLPGMLGAGIVDDRVEVDVVFDDGTLQSWADAEHGDGTVRVSSALVPAE